MSPCSNYAKPYVLFRSIMFEHQIAFSDEFIMMDNQMPQSDSRVEVQVAHGQRFLENIPKGFLGVLNKKISVERQLTFRQALAILNWNFTSELAAVGLCPIVVPPMK